MNGICTLVRIKAPYTAWEQVYSWPYGTTPYDLDVSPAGDRIVASFGNIEGKQEVQLLDWPAWRTASDAGGARSTSGQSVPEQLHVLARRAVPVRQLVLHRRLEHLPLRDRDTGGSRPCRNTDTGFFRPIPLGDDRLIVFRYTGRGFVPGARSIATAARRTSAPITFLGERLAEEQPIVKTWNVGSPLAIPFDDDDAGRGPYRLAARDSGPNRSIRCCRATRTRPRSACALNFSDPLQLEPRECRRRRVARTRRPAGRRARAPDGPTTSATTGAGAPSWNNADFYDLFGPTKVGRKGYDVGRRPHEHADLRRAAPARARRRRQLSPATSIGCPSTRTCGRREAPVRPSTRKLAYTDVRNSLGSVDDETGTRWTLVGELNVVDGSVHRGVRGDYDRGFALPAGPLVDLVPRVRRVSRPSDRARAVRELLLRRLRQQLRRPSRREALPRVLRVSRRRAQRDRRPELREVDGRV